MLRVCAICGKKPIIGKKVVRKGLAKSKGGTGQKIVRSSKRYFLPNLQRMRILIDNRPRRVYVCTRCLKKGEILKA
jgi:large subunit ribosomal protein L28